MRGGSGGSAFATRRQLTLPDSPAALPAVFRAVDRSAAWLRQLSPRQRYAAAIISGGVATLSLPPVNFLPALILTVTAFVWLLEGIADRRRACFALGWCFGFGYFILGLYWIGNALLVFGERHAWMLPFSAIGLPALLALFTGVAALVAGFARGRVAMILAVAVTFAAMDWLRGHVLTGLPWNLFGHAWSGLDTLLQSASIYGIYGVGLGALLSAALPAGLAGGGLRSRLTCLAAATALILFHWGYGAYRLDSAALQESNVGIRLVQANIPQREKWALKYRARNITAHYSLSREDRPAWVSHVIWPEMAATLYLEEDAQARRVLAGAVPKGGLLLTGAPRRAPGTRGSHNSILALNDAGEIIGHYDKAHLVPFGEYVPLATWLSIEKITDGAIGYRPGPGVRTLRLPGLPAVSLLVCYEVIFPGAVVDRGDRPRAIINLTNDAWYGISAGPHQHFANARVRAVEEGMPLVRAAYTGVSGVVDSHGTVIGTIPLNQKGYLDFRLPEPLSDPPIYARFGDTLFAVFLGIFTFAAIVLSRRNGRKSVP